MEISRICNSKKYNLETLLREMDQLFGEIQQKRAAMGLGDINPITGPNNSFNPYASEEAARQQQRQPGERPSDAYSDAELMQIYESMRSGNAPPEMK